MTDLAPTLEPVVDDVDPSRLAHIVHAPEGRAGAVVTEARVMGLPVVALCGWRWVPSRDPERHPLCEKCAAIYQGIHR